MSDKNKNFDPEKRLNVLRTLKKSDLKAPAFTATRVEAALRERKERSILSLKSFGAGMAFSCALLLLVIFNVGDFYSPQDKIYSVSFDSPAVVKYSIEEYTQASYVVVQLDVGMKFYSSRYEIKENEVGLDLNKVRSSGSDLSIVVKANETGKKKVYLKFYNQQGELVGSKESYINFTKA